MKLPKRYLSHSAKSLWLTSREQFRAKYYRNEPSHQTPEMLFGVNIAKQLETGNITDPILEGFVTSGSLILHPEREHRIEVEVEGINLLGVLDSYDIDSHAFRDTKTGHKNPQGDHAWTQRKVDRHAQLPFYAILIEAKHGNAPEECGLDYLETRWKRVTENFNGIELEGKSDELELTGYIESFTRAITPMDRYRELENIVQVAHEISDDYERYLNTI